MANRPTHNTRGMGLANALAAQGYALRAGDRITTGTTMPPPPIGSNQDVVADFGPLGQVSLRIGG